MSKAEIGPLLTKIGHEIASSIDGDPDGAFLFAEVGYNWAGGAIFVDEGEAVRWVQPSHELAELLRDLWAIDNAGKSEAEGWVCMEYDIRGEKFRASFSYRDDLPAGSTFEDWEDAAVANRFGDKPVVYPPMATMDDASTEN